MTVTLTAAWRCLTAGSRKPAVSEKEEGGGKGLNLPYRRYGGDISSPNLVEGTCLGASHTYRGTLCGRFPGGSRDEDYRRSEGGLHHHNVGKKNQKRKNGRGERQKSLLIRFPGYDDLECHLSLFSGFRKGSQGRKEERGLQRTPCEEVLNGGGWWSGVKGTLPWKWSSE